MLLKSILKFLLNKSSKRVLVLDHFFDQFSGRAFGQDIPEIDDPGDFIRRHALPAKINDVFFRHFAHIFQLKGNDRL